MTEKSDSAMTYLGEPIFDWRPGKSLRLFHGTLPQFIPGILKNGILPARLRLERDRHAIARHFDLRLRWHLSRLGLSPKIIPRGYNWTKFENRLRGPVFVGVAYEASPRHTLAWFETDNRIMNDIAYWTGKESGAYYFGTWKKFMDDIMLPATGIKIVPVLHIEIPERMMRVSDIRSLTKHGIPNSWEIRINETIKPNLIHQIDWWDVNVVSEYAFDRFNKSRSANHCPVRINALKGSPVRICMDDAMFTMMQRSSSGRA